MHKKKFKKRKNNNGGKYSFDDYANSNTEYHKVDEIKPGDCCLKCKLGKYYKGEEQKLLEWHGKSILDVTRHVKETLRCNRCGDIVVPNTKITKWTNEAKSSIAIYKLYGTPLYRIARLQKMFGIPVASSTLWEKYAEIHHDAGKYIVTALFELAPESEKLLTDDTGMRILEVMEANEQLAEKDKRACHTTVMCFEHQQGKIILYNSANRYCKENWKPILSKRQSENKMLILTDASNQSYPTGKELEKSHAAACLGSHASRKFKDLQNNYPEECSYFIDLISKIYKNDRECLKLHLSSEERLKYHQKNSKIHIDAIYNKINLLFTNKEVEPNSDLGKAMKYWLNHKDKLTKFLEVPNCPLDNNWAEFNLRIIALYRKTSMFFKTLDTAQINSDLFSIMASCEANKINTFQYLNWIQINWLKVQKEPHKYLPWNFTIDTEKIAV